MLSRLLRFTAVGASAALLLFALTWALAAAGLPAFAAGALAYAGAFAVAYTAQHNWTFGGRAAHRRALPRYFAVQLFCAGLASLSAHVASVWLGWPDPAVSAFVTVVASATSFVLSLAWAFAEPAR